MGEREGDDEGGAASFADALDADGAAVEFDELFDDGESEPESAEGAGGGGVGLAEAFEDVRKEFRGDAFAGIGDADFNLAVVALEGDGDGAAAGGEFDGIGEEIPENLLDAAGIAEDGAWSLDFFDKADFFGLGGGLGGSGGGFQEPGGIDDLCIEADFSAQDAGHVEEIVDEFGLHTGVAFDDFHSGGDFGGIVRHAEKDLRPAEDGVERGAEFVRDRGEEFILDAVGAFGVGASGAFAFKERFAFALVGLNLFDLVADLILTLPAADSGLDGADQ